MEDYGRTRIDDHARTVYRFFRGLFALFGIFCLFVVIAGLVGVWNLVT